MVLDVILVILFDLCLMVQFDGGCFVISDFNDFYWWVINCNNCLVRFQEILVFEIIVCNEKWMFQEVVDVFIDNGCCGCIVVGVNNCLFKLLSDIIEGKQGCFCQNFLGKWVDYFGCLVIVVGLKLKMYQCGLFKEMVIELFQFFVIYCLICQNIVNNIKVVKKLIQWVDDEVMQVL